MSGEALGVDNGGPTLPSAQGLKKRYMDRCTRRSRSRHVFYGYDAAMLLARAMKEAGADAAAIKTALPKVVQGYQGATGRIQWDQNGQRVAPPIEFLEYKDGKFSSLQVRN